MPRKTTAKTATQPQPARTAGTTGTTTAPRVKTTAPNIIHIRPSTRWRHKSEPVHFFARWAIALYKSGNNEQGAAKFAAEVMEDELLSRVLRQRSPANMVRAAVNGGATDDPDYAASLIMVREASEQFIEMLRDASVFMRLSKDRFLTFDVAGGLRIPRQTRGVRGGWVGEGEAIPVQRPAFGSISLQPRKMAVITFTSQEMLDHTDPGVLELITTDLVEGTAGTIDRTFAGADPATAARPAGLQVLGGTTASAGNTLANIRTDIKAAKMALARANIPMVSPVWIMSETTRIALEMVQDSVGQNAFPDMRYRVLESYPVLSSNAVGDVLILTDSSELLAAMDLAPVVDSSTAATLNTDDAPADADIGPGGGVTTPVLSMFQTDQVAVRIRQRLDWELRHANATHTIRGVSY